MPQSTEEHLIQRYFDAFNRHDLQGVMECFHDEPLLIDLEGRQYNGRTAVRQRYEYEFASFPDGRCEVRTMTGHSGCGMAESVFVGIHARTGQRVSAIGPEVVEFVDGKIKSLRDYHRVVAG